MTTQFSVFVSDGNGGIAWYTASSGPSSNVLSFLVDVAERATATAMLALDDAQLRALR